MTSLLSDASVSATRGTPNYTPASNTGSKVQGDDQKDTELRRSPQRRKPLDKPTGKDRGANAVARPLYIRVGRISICVMRCNVSSCLITGVPSCLSVFSSVVSVCALHAVSPRDLWCVLPRWQFTTGRNVNVNVHIWVSPIFSFRLFLSSLPACVSLRGLVLSSLLCFVLYVYTT